MVAAVRVHKPGGPEALVYEDIEVGAPMRMMFRIKAVDELRGFTKYFWKAAPDFRPKS